MRDLVADVSWNYEVNKSIQPFTPPADRPQEEWRWQQQDIERVQEYRKCIECFLCQDVCHVLRNHETEKPFMGPRFLVRTAGLEMHPIDAGDRRGYLKDVGGIGYCNITKCCTEVCPEHIKITDNAIIPLKERVADEFYDPIQWAWRKLRGKSSAGRGRHAAADAPGRLGGIGCRGSSRGATVAPPRATSRPRKADPARVREPPLTLGFDDEPEPDESPAPGSSARKAPKPVAAPASPTSTRGFVVRTDGAARGNPGPASAGAVLLSLARPDARNPRAEPDASISDYLGIQTNNVAEYTAVVRAVALGLELGARRLELLLDSKLIVEQISGRWRVKDAKLRVLWAEVLQLLRPTARRLDRGARPARPELPRRRHVQRGDRPRDGRRPRIRRAPTGLKRVAPVELRSQRDGRMAARRRGQPGGVRKVRAPQRRVVGNTHPPRGEDQRHSDDAGETPE